MKYFFLIAILSMSSCSVKYYPLKGHYPETPIIYTSEKSFDKVWDNIIDFFAQKGISIAVIDRTSGLIVSSQSGIIGTTENSKGQLRYKEAFFVLQSSNAMNDNSDFYKKINMTAKWNIRIKKIDSGTSININLTDAERTILLGNGAKQATAALGRTTGVFENLVYNDIK